MRDDFASDIGATSARVRHVRGLEMNHRVALEDVESVAEGADHGVIADAGHILEARHDGHGGANRGPIVAAKVALQCEGKYAGIFGGLRESQALYDALHIFGVLEELERIVGFWRGALRGPGGIPARLLDRHFLKLCEGCWIREVRATRFGAFHDFLILLDGNAERLLQVLP